MSTQEQDQAIEKLASHVANIVQVSGTRAQDFLILTNAGGIVACLGLIGSSSPHASDWALRLFLVMYLLGLSLAGWTMIRGFRYALRLASGFRSSVDAFRAGTGEWTAVLTLFARVPNERFASVGLMIGGASIVLFTAATLGACAWLLLVSAPT